MKKYSIQIIFSAFVLLLIGISSCNKDFLEKPKGGAVTVDTIFHTKNQAQYAVAQMYNLCITTYFPMNDPTHCRPDAITDQLYIIHPAYDWAATSINAGTYNAGNESPDESIDKGGYWGHYKGIRQANLVLKNIDAVTDADAAWIRDVKGQAIFCRAWQHFELFRLYGGIPIVTEPLDGTQNLTIRRSSLAAVVDSIVNWCDEAAGMLPPTRSGSEYGKITSLAALALKARTLLYAASPIYNTPGDLQAEIAGARYGDGRDSVLAYPDYSKERWNLAAQAALDVINHAAQSNVALFNTGKPRTTGDSYATLGDYESVSNVYANSELILVNTANQASSDFFWGTYLHSKLRLASWGVKNNVPIEFMQQYEKADGSKWTLPSSGDDFPVDVQKLDLDPRFYQTIAYDGMRYNNVRGTLAYYRGGDGYADGNLSSSDAGLDGYAMETYKFVARIDNMNDNHFAWPIFRLAEFYLSYAEAINEYQGPTSDALKYLNLIRQRAGMPDKQISDQGLFRLAIQNERTIEFAYEGLRYNDLNRWLLARKVLNGTLHGVQTTAKNVGGQLKRSWQVVTFMNRVFPFKYYYVPFPNNEVSKNYLGDGDGWDGQNPGW